MYTHQTCARVIYIYILFFFTTAGIASWAEPITTWHANCRVVKNIVNSVPPTLNCFHFYQRITPYIIIFQRTPLFEKNHYYKISNFVKRVVATSHPKAVVSTLLYVGTLEVIQFRYREERIKYGIMVNRYYRKFIAR